jgi:electron transfer flavoprotein alpha subunit
MRVLPLPLLPRSPVSPRYCTLTAMPWRMAWLKTWLPRCGVAGSYSHILFPATASGKNVAPRVAAKLDVGQISDITKVVPLTPFERPIYAGNAIATVQSADAVKVLTVRTTNFDPAATYRWQCCGGGVAAAAAAQATFVGSEIAKNDRPELTAAKIIVSGGRALGSAKSSTKS